MKIINTEQAARELGVTTRRVLALITSGRLPAAKLASGRKPGRPRKEIGMFGDIKSVINYFYNRCPEMLQYQSAKEWISKASKAEFKDFCENEDVGEANMIEWAFHKGCSDWVTEHHHVNSVGGFEHGTGYTGMDNRCEICFPH